MSLHIVILAAGLGKRMYSRLPKVLHPLAGKPLLMWVIEAAQRLQPEQIHIVYGNGGDVVQQALAGQSVHWVRQEKQLGTGHAVLQAIPAIPDAAKVLILSADVPLIHIHTLTELIDTLGPENVLSLLVAQLDNPHGLGRILRKENNAIYAIVEEKDANNAEKQIQEIYTGVCVARAAALKRWLPNIHNLNGQEEYYLTDIIAMAVSEGAVVQSVQVHDPMEIQGVNTRLQLQQLERVWQRRRAEELLLSGVMIADANRFDVRGELTCGQDVFIDVNCVFIGKVHLGDGVRIGPHCMLSDCDIDTGAEILPHTIIDGASIGEFCQVGPFARIRPGTQLGPHCKIGNFVEAKKALFAEHSKASHLSYLGDVEIGKDVNIGAGTITCNYDGVNKYQTIIEDGVFIGSDTQLVAPVRIGADATIGAGSTIRKDVPPGELTLTESRQKTVYGWKRPKMSE